MSRSSTTTWLADVGAVEVASLNDAEAPGAAEALARGEEAAASGSDDDLAVDVALGYSMAKDDARAEALLRKLLGRRWLSGWVRRDAVHDLRNLLERQGRAEAAAALLAGEDERRQRLRDEASGTVKRAGPKVGRNEACPCGSELKYKKCCEAA